MASDFYLVLPSNSSMDIHPNNTLAQYIINLPRRISLHGEWDCGLTDIYYPHDWYNVRNARRVVEHEESLHNVYLDDGYYDSPETLVEAINLNKVSRVNFSYDSVTQKVRAHLKSKRSSGCTVILAIFWDSTTSHRMQIIRLRFQPTPSSI